MSLKLGTVRLFAVALLFSAFSLTFAQSYPVSNITFSGDGAYSSRELLAAAGLTVGASLDQAGMQLAAQRLNASGMFSNIRFSFNGKELHYELTPATTLAPVRFVNFPWWDAKQIAAQVSAAAPLFHGQASPGSGMQQQIVDALTALLATKQIQATLAATPDVDLASGKTRFLDFRISEPPVQIGAVTFTGASPDFTARLAEIAKAAGQVDYSAIDTSSTLTQAVEHVYREQGYLEGRVSSITDRPPVLDAAGGSQVVKVPFAIVVDEGVQYRLGSFSLAGSVLMDQADFQSKALLKPGDVIEGEKLRRTMQMISSPYVTRGYLRAKISATPSLHRDQQKADYAINVNPGDVYHMGKLEVKDLDEDRKALFLKVWKLDAGAPYDTSYVSQFLKKNAKDLHPLDGYSASYKQFEHEDTHIVDLVVSFRKGGPLS